MSLNVGKDIEYQMSLVKRETGESDIKLAERLYWIQQDAVDANCQGNASPARTFWGLSEAQIESWIEKAKTYK